MGYHIYCPTITNSFTRYCFWKPHPQNIAPCQAPTNHSPHWPTTSTGSAPSNSAWCPPACAWPWRVFIPKPTLLPRLVSLLLRPVMWQQAVAKLNGGICDDFIPNRGWKTTAELRVGRVEQRQMAGCQA